MKAERRPADELLKAQTAHWPEAATPIAQLMVRVYRLSGLVQDNATRQVALHGLSFTEFEALVALRNAQPPHELLPTELYTSILISSGGLTKVLHGLQRRGLIARGQSKQDRRSKPIRLTAKGRGLAERAMADVLRSDGQLILGGLSPREVERLTGLLRKLLTTLEPAANGAAAGPE
jgi:DNA-binding MarR family transcriptional regulator